MAVIVAEISVVWCYGSNDGGGHCRHQKKPLLNETVIITCCGAMVVLAICRMCCRSAHSMDKVYCK
jgi:hypothetical protein